MDSIQNSILFKILYYLPGNDVARFVQLNKTFRGVIEDKREFLKKPRLCLYISDWKDSCLNEYGKRRRASKMCIFVDENFSNDNSSSDSFDLMRCLDFTRKFLEPFLKVGNTVEKSMFEALCDCVYYSDDVIYLRSLLDFILGRADVEIEAKLQSNQNIRILTEAVKNTNNSIHSIRANLDNSNAIEHFELISAVGRQKLKSYNFPKLWITLDRNNPFNWSTLEKLNDLCSLYQCAHFVIPAKTAVENIAEIAMNWRKLNFPLLYFNLEIDADWENDLEVELDERIGDTFNVSYDCPLQFFKCALNKQESRIRLEDRNTGKVLQFDKGNEEISTRHLQDTWRHNLYTFAVKISVD